MTTPVGIFFPFYGAKFQWALKYPAPEHSVIIEPFAGAAGYSLRYHDARVALNDADPVITGVWDYLIHSSEQDIQALPLLEPGGDARSLNVCQEARWLIGFWVNPGSATPKHIMTTYSAYPPGDPRHRATRTWGAAIRERIARQKPLIAHWTIRLGDYRELAPARDATWFIDPPYQHAGRHYRIAVKDYDSLSAYARSRQGQVIACESTGATWLPFSPLFETGTSSGSPGARRYSEAIWTDAPHGHSDAGIFEAVAA